MTSTNSIKRGVSLYSFQEEFFLRKMTLEDCIAAAAELGALGIETIGEQMIPGFPRPTPAFYEQWHGWMAKYGTTPVAHDAYLDTKRWKHRLLTDDEMFDELKLDVEHTARLGCPNMRCVVTTPPHIMERLTSFAEQHNVRIGLEIHSPFNFDHDLIKRHLEVVERLDSPYLGIVPDMGIFERRFPRVRSDRYLRRGAHPEIVAYIAEAYARHSGNENIVAEVEKMGGNQFDLAMARDVSHMVFTNPRDLLHYIPRILHIHGKFYEMLDDGTEYSIPYDEVIAVLIEGGYSGYINSEYEGNRHIQDAFEVDSVEQVRRQQAMFERLLGEAA